MAGTVLVETSLAAVPSGLLERTLKSVIAGGSKEVQSLAKGVVVNMTVTRMGWLALVAVGLAIVLGAGYQAHAARMRKAEADAKELVQEKKGTDAWLW